jgi:hypothetical protein
MLSHEHQFRVALIKEHPELAAMLLAVPLPRYSKVELADATFPQHMPTEYHADALVLLEDAESRPLLSILVEVQTRADPEKHGTWPFYLASVFKDRRCPVVLLVLAADEKTAEWAAQSIELGPGGSRIVPQVVGPRQVPRIESLEDARRSPWLAVLSAVTYAPEPDSIQVVWAGIEALRSGAFSAQSVRFFHDFIYSKMEESAFKALEKLMEIKGYEYQSEFARRHFAEGKAEGKGEGAALGVAKALGLLLKQRNLVVSTEQAQRIEDCRDQEQLLTWFNRALIAQSAADVFDP